MRAGMAEANAPPCFSRACVYAEVHPLLPPKSEKVFVAPQPGLDETTRAKLMLVLLAFAWGLSWPFMKMAVDEVGVWWLRFLGLSVGAASLFALIKLQGRNPSIPRGRARLHVVAAAVVNVVGFGLFVSFAQLAVATSRVVIVNYSMPVWASLLGWLILGERLNLRAGIGLALCVGGLAALVVPAMGEHATTTGLLLALGCALSWAAGTVYMKWAKIPGDLLTITAWQLAVGVVAFAGGLLIFQGTELPASVSWQGMLGVLFTGLIGVGLGYLLWFAIIERLPTATASLGTLATPVIGVGSSMLMLGERPTLADIIGFALILAAAACVLVPGRSRPAAL
jgi:drug/metabolite transporter (DMT)-like permease